MTANEKESILNYQTKILVKLFLEENLSDKELEERTGYTSSSIQRRLSDQERITKIFGEKIANKVAEIRANNKEIGKIKGTKTSHMLYGNLFDLDTIFMGEDISADKQLDLLKHIMLTYRVNLDTVVNEFDLNKIFEYAKEQNKYDINTTPQDNLYVMLDVERGNGLYYLLHLENANQEAAVAYLRGFLSECRRACENNNTVRMKQLIRQVNDSQAKKLMKAIKESDGNYNLTDDDFFIILKTQLKYSWKKPVVADAFGISISPYRNYIAKTIADENGSLHNSELARRYNELSETYSDSFKNRLG